MLLYSLPLNSAAAWSIDDSFFDSFFLSKLFSDSFSLAEIGDDGREEELLKEPGEYFLDLIGTGGYASFEILALSKAET